MKAKRLVFKIGQAFPASPTVSVFITAICIAVNDLLMVNKLILRSIDEDGPSVERLYLLRLSFAQVHELRETIAYARRGENVRTFLADLPKAAREDLARVEDLNTPEHRWVEDAIKYVRNQTIHYGGRWNFEDLEWAMAKLSNVESTIDMTDQTVGGTRFRFADEIVNKHLERKFPEYGEDANAELDDAVIRARLSILFRRMQEATTAAFRFTMMAAKQHLDMLPDDVVRCETEDD